MAKSVQIVNNTKKGKWSGISSSGKMSKERESNAVNSKKKKKSKNSNSPKKSKKPKNTGSGQESSSCYFYSLGRGKSTKQSHENSFEDEK